MPDVGLWKADFTGVCKEVAHDTKERGNTRPSLLLLAQPPRPRFREARLRAGAAPRALPLQRVLRRLAAHAPCIEPLLVTTPPVLEPLALPPTPVSANDVKGELIAVKQAKVNADILFNLFLMLINVSFLHSL